MSYVNFLKRWYSIILFFVITLLVCIFLQENIKNIPIKAEQKDMVETISWLFSGVVSIISFLSIFVGFIYDNKLINASNTLREIYKPYGMDTEGYRVRLVNYHQYISKGITLNAIYWIILVCSNVCIIIWFCTLEILYNPFPLVLSFENIATLCLLSMWCVFSILLFLLVVYLNRINNNKDPLGKEYLPNSTQILDVDFLVTQEVDVDEIFMKVGPYIEFYKNPQPQKSYELNIVFSHPISNYKYVITIYDKDKNALFKCFGVYQLKSILGQKLHHNLTTELDERIYTSINSFSTGEIKIYSVKNNKLLCRLSLTLICEENKKVSSTLRSISHLSMMDIDKGLLIDKNKEFHSLRFESM